MMLATLAREYEIVNRKRVRRVVLQPGTRKGQYISNKRFASQTKPMQDCHPERSEGSLAGQRSFAPLRMTKPDGLLFEMYCPQGPHRPVPLHVARPLAPPSCLPCRRLVVGRSSEM